VLANASVVVSTVLAIRFSFGRQLAGRIVAGVRVTSHRRIPVIMPAAPAT
jgi:hypothetical protein